ncbi:lipoyl protein ligase domain-containing protein [Erysipelothrix urinaevulpis]|uniref:lipoate--protein ligase family protein n=1 Tax=Erysipelothrix urinaevulpis TaxID=2683717 RepID=UPI001357E39A|nr:protein ligase [Erysipelothrix urinaevulpis]
MKAILINELNDVNTDPLISTAIDDYSLRNLEDNTIVMHLFQHKGVNMGTDDIRIKNIQKGLDYYRQHGQEVTFRQSGGRSIIADEGVISMSLTFPSLGDVKLNYDYYSDFITQALAPLSTDIKTYEITGAYCPGDSDMSINGQKFCGTAQKQLGQRVEMDCYIAVNGDQTKRSKLVKGFYDVMEYTDIPIVLDTMATLSDLSHQHVSIDDVSKLLISELKKRTSSLHERTIESFDHDKFEFSVQHIKRKHNLVKGDLK